MLTVRSCFMFADFLHSGVCERVEEVKKLERSANALYDQ